jgi:hypothetical protein
MNILPKIEPIHLSLLLFNFSNLKSLILSSPNGLSNVELKPILEPVQFSL